MYTVHRILCIQNIRPYTVYTEPNCRMFTACSIPYTTVHSVQGSSQRSSTLLYSVKSTQYCDCIQTSPLFTHNAIVLRWPSQKKIRLNSDNTRMQPPPPLRKYSPKIIKKWTGHFTNPFPLLEKWAACYSPTTLNSCFKIIFAIKIALKSIVSSDK